MVADRKQSGPEWRGTIGAAMLTICAVAAPAMAHEVGTTGVAITLDGSRYEAVLTVDPQPLLAKLDAAAGRARSPRLTADEYRRRLERHQAELLAHVHVRFDGTRAAPAVTRITAQATEGDELPGLTTVRAEIGIAGEIPSGARALTWLYDLTYVRYPLTLRQGRTAVGRLEWLDGSMRSQPFVVARARSWWTRDVLESSAAATPARPSLGLAAVSLLLAGVVFISRNRNHLTAPPRRGERMCARSRPMRGMQIERTPKRPNTRRASASKATS
jgi:hypothetical protein